MLLRVLKQYNRIKYRRDLIEADNKLSGMKPSQPSSSFLNAYTRPPSCLFEAYQLTSFCFNIEFVKTLKNRSVLVHRV